jgi:hypothetical protein
MFLDYLSELENCIFPALVRGGRGRLHSRVARQNTRRTRSDCGSFRPSWSGIATAPINRPPRYCDGAACPPRR